MTRSTYLRNLLFVFAFSILPAIVFAADLSSEVEQLDGHISAITLSNKLLKVRISERGAKLDSLKFLPQAQEYCSEQAATFAGLGKIRDVLYNNIETVSELYKLSLDDSIAGQLTVTANFKAQSGNLAGMEIIRKYTLFEDSSVVDCYVMLRSLQQDNSFQINLHNLFPTSQFSENINFYLPSKRGLAVFDYAAAKVRKLNLILDLQAPWCAFVDQNSGNGMAILFPELEQLEGIYVWGQNDGFTLETNYKNVQLKPIVAADEWEMRFQLMPLQNMKNLQQLDKNIALAAEKLPDKQIKIKLLSTSAGKGKLSAWQNKKKLIEQNVEFSDAAQLQTLSFTPEDINAAYEIKFDTANFSSSFNLAADFDKKKTIALAKELPKKELSGVTGFYYYFPELWLSDESPGEIAIGLRGNFPRHEELRCILDLPKGVNISWCGTKILAESEIEIDGKKYQRYELNSWRKATYYAALFLNLHLDNKFQEGSKLYLRAKWPGGEQSAQEIPIKKAPSMPDIGSGLKHFKLAVQHNTDKSGWPAFNKIGINSIIVNDWAPPLVLYDFKGKGYFLDRIKEIEDAGMFPLYGSPDPYVNIGRVLDKLEPFYTGGGTFFHPEKRVLPLDVDQAKAVDINGKQLKMPCPSYHGPLLDKAVDSLKCMIEYGFDHVVYDEEMWGNGTTLCFCDRCKNKFAEFLQKKYPNVTYVDPVEATLNPLKYANVEDAWWDFKTDQVAEIYRVLRETLETYSPKPGVKRQMWVWVDYSTTGKRYGAITNRLTDYNKLGKYADLLVPMIYTPNSADVGMTMKNGEALLEGSPGKIAGGLSANRTYEYYRVIANNLAPMDVYRYQILETFFNGGQAVIIWAHSSALRCAYDHYQIATAVRTIMPVEDILKFGKATKDIVANSNPRVNIRTYEYDGKIAVFVSNYNSETVKTKLTFPRKYKKAINTSTDEEFMISNGMEVEFSNNRAMVFLVD